jgi:hypothetical protein
MSDNDETPPAEPTPPPTETAPPDDQTPFRDPGMEHFLGSEDYERRNRH